MHRQDTTVTIRILCLVLVAIAGCSHGTGPELLPTMPLAVGNRWIYIIDRGELDTFEIVSQISDNGETWYVGSDSMQYCNRINGLWMRRANTTQHVCLSSPAPGDTLRLTGRFVIVP